MVVAPCRVRRDWQAELRSELESKEICPPLMWLRLSMWCDRVDMSTRLIDRRFEKRLTAPRGFIQKQCTRGCKRNVKTEADGEY